jgi:hypothetical protein|tara:strand:+ start:1849 stop:2358 length:510 start_codon:yes stop_codon:yes gene_type:complete
MTKKPIKNPTQGQIKKFSPEDTITSFYGLDGAAASLKASSFDLMEEINTIISHVRDPDPKVSLTALKQFRSVMKEITTNNGMFATIQQTEVVDDNISRTVSSSTLLTNLRNQNDQIHDQKEIEQKHEILAPKSISKKEKNPLPRMPKGCGPIKNNDGDGASTISSSGNS